jgi:hypothetical protein
MNEAHSSTENTPLALAAFDALRAEDEPWLADCFVPPSDFSLIAGARSVIVYGEEGSGKTALYQMLVRYLRPTQRPPERLVVEWHPPRFEPETPADSAMAEKVVEDVLSTCAAALMRQIVQWPDRVAAAPDDVKSTLAWFIQHYSPSAWDESGQSALPPSVQDEFLAHASLPRRISELIKALIGIGLSGIWVFTAPDDFGYWDDIRPGLAVLLSSLSLLDHPRLVYKLILSAIQKSSVWDSSGIERRRLDLIPLRWLESELRSVVERHLAVATEDKITRLDDLCKDKGLASWLARTGGDTPRGWLEEIRPIAARYFAQGRPLTVKEWKEIRRQRPPRLSVDFEIGRVVVGRREVETIGAGELALLRYLHQNRGRVCSRAELFHKAYLPAVTPLLVKKPPPTEFTKEFEGTLDTALWRLRGAIEPDPKDPLYVVTHRGQGVRLENV